MVALKFISKEKNLFKGSNRVKNIATIDVILMSLLLEIEVFSCKFKKFLRRPFYYKHLQTAAFEGEDVLMECLL